MLKAGAATREFTPKNSQFLYGYPHVPRMSEGVHDPLLSAALYLENRGERVLWIANDIVYVPRPQVLRIRAAIAASTGLEPDHILISATHTHSGPKTMESPLGKNDPVIPPVDPAFLDQMTGAILQAGIEAVRRAEPAEIGFAVADATGIGTNRHDPRGPDDLDVPVLAVRSRPGKHWLAWMHVCAMHPTVLHEDSRRVSADFPWAARDKLQRELLGSTVPVLHHTGCAGNQSPRHVTRANTFAEVERIGGMLGEALIRAAGELVYEDDPVLRVARRLIDPPRKRFPSVAEAQANLDQARQRFESLKRTGPATEARTAECDVFGAEHRLFLSRIVRDGALDPVYADCTPAEIQVIRVGERCYTGWPAETYVEYALAVRAQDPKTFAISLANGTLNGYITTPEAAADGSYEAGAALFSPETGPLMVQTTLEIVRELRSA